MNLNQQLKESTLASAMSIRSLKRRRWGTLGLYVLLASILIGLVSAFFVSHEGEVHQTIAHYLFPESWHFAVHHLIERFLASQSRLVLVNVAIMSSLLLISMVLFRVKERLSFGFEQDAELISEPADELPLLVEFWEEVKLFLFYITMTMTLFWVAYHPAPWRHHLALVLSYVFLFLTVAIDFISPTLFRHKMKYAVVIKTLLKHPVATLAFGCTFALPPLLAAHLLNALGVTHWGITLFIVSAAQILSIVWACVGGTYLAAQFFEPAKNMRPPMVITQVSFWCMLLGLFFMNLYAFGGLARTIHHKSPLFKCQYSIVEGSFDLEPPSVVGALSDLVRGRFKEAVPKVIDAVGDAREGKVKTLFSFDLEIKNENEVPLQLEENRLELRYKSDLITTTRIQPFQVAPGTTKIETIALKVSLNKELIKQLPLIWSEGTGDLEITLYVRVAKYLELPIYLKSR
jgi:hypothetical protein